MPDIPTSAFKDNVLPTFTDDFVKEAPFYSGRGRALRVVCIGAGAAGIYLGIKLPRSFREGAVDLQVSRFLLVGCLLLQLHSTVQYCVGFVGYRDLFRR